ncbi:VOC family protein [Brevibacillus brevis]|uniref:VOC family protein n=1 Tax=Brevibacillus brevis TaxID=1393 RepID=A0ABY9T2J7_BREBE|nr:VOC family protein [Brevibacillus brevis]WNC14057.1 VOC family protein [Brevibacillus brevis]
MGIAYNVIPVKDAKKSGEWFVRHFGFTIRNDRGNYLSLFRDNRPILDVIESDNDTRAVFEVNGRTRWVITFFTDDIEALYARLTSDGVKTRPISNEGIYGKFFVFEDPDGNLFDVWEHKDCELLF